MALLLKIMAIWGIGDGVWMALDPAAWSRFWRGAMAFLGRAGTPPRLTAFAQAAFCLYLLSRSRD